MEGPDGVYERAGVSRMAPLSGNGITVCTEPLPKLRVMILHRSRDDLTGGGGTAVDQHHQRCTVEDVYALGAQPQGILGMASTRGDDLAPTYEIAGDGDSLIEQTTR